MWLRTLGGIVTRKTSQEKTRMANQGAGFNWGISLVVIKVTGFSTQANAIIF